MVELIDDGTIARCKCENCDSVVQYSKLREKYGGDVESEWISTGETCLGGVEMYDEIFYIECPRCGGHIRVAEPIEHRRGRLEY